MTTSASSSVLVDRDGHVADFAGGPVGDERNARLANAAHRALGRKPRDFAHYARDAAIAGVCNAPAMAA
jgi:hypothetical protein